MKYIRKVHGDYFCLSVAGYPEGHPNVIKTVPEGTELTESEKKRIVVSKKEDGSDLVQVCFDADYESEIQYLKSKVDAGADMIIVSRFCSSPPP